MNQETKQKIIDAVQENEIPLADIAKKLYISERQLKILLHSWGVMLPQKRHYRSVPTPPRDELVRLYNSLRTTQKVAGHYEVSIGVVARWMKELRIPPRKLVKMTDGQKTRLLEDHIQQLGNINL